MPLDDTELLRRIDGRLKERGFSSRRELCISAGISGSFLGQRGEAGYGIRNLEKIAQTLGWSICQLMDCHCDGATEADLSLVEMATRTVARGLWPSKKPDVFAQVVLEIYGALLDRRREGKPIGEAELSGIESAIRSRARRL